MCTSLRRGRKAGIVARLLMAVFVAGSFGVARSIRAADDAATTARVRVSADPPGNPDVAMTADPVVAGRVDSELAVPVSEAAEAGSNSIRSSD